MNIARVASRTRGAAVLASCVNAGRVAAGARSKRVAETSACNGEARTIFTSSGAHVQQV